MGSVLFMQGAAHCSSQVLKTVREGVTKNELKPLEAIYVALFQNRQTWAIRLQLTTILSSLTLQPESSTMLFLLFYRLWIVGTTKYVKATINIF